MVIVAALALLALKWRPADAAGIVTLGVIAGGAASNLIDRVRLGGVTDFIEVHLWPTDFNLADAAIRLGVLAYLGTLLWETMRRRRRSSPD